MRAVIKIKTFDGVEHVSTDLAKRHLDRIYADRLCSIGHKLVKLDNKYTQILDFVDANLELFLELDVIKSDMEIEKDDEPDWSKNEEY